MTKRIKNERGKLVSTNAKFKVWVTIELVDEDSDTWEDQGLPTCIQELSTLEEAEKFVVDLESELEDHQKLGACLGCPRSK